MSYLYEIAKEFLPTMQDRQWTIWNFPQMEGRKVSKNYFFSSVFRSNLEKKNKRTFVVNSGGRKPFTCNDLETFLQKQERFTYFTPQIYYHYRSRMKDKLSYLNCFVLDFDLAKDGTGREYTPDELSDVIFNELDLRPHFIYETKTEGNFNVVFLIKEISASENTIYLYESILKRLAILLGSDISSTDAVHLFRIPKKEIYNYESILNIYDIDDFKFVLEDEEINNRLEDLRTKYLTSKVVSLSEHQIMSLKSVQKLSDCEIEGYRNHACFTLALLFYALGKDQADVEKFYYEYWYQRANDSRFSSRFTKKEIRDSVRSAFSGKYTGPSREWVEFLTDEPFPINLYRSSYLKKPEDERVYMSKTVLRSRLINWVKKNSHERITQKELAVILEVPYRSLQLQIKQLKVEGILEVETTKGRNAKSKFELKENKFVVKTDVKDTFILEHSTSKKEA